MRKPKITILYDSAEESARSPRSLLVCEQTQKALADSAYEVRTLAVGRNIRELARRIEEDDSDLLFNLCESLGGVSHFEQNVAALLELMGRRFTGAGSLGLALAQDKALAKKVLAFHDIRSPKFSSMDAGEVEWSDDLEFPVIVKPSNQDASIGIEAASIVDNLKDLMERISYVQTEFHAPALIEEFIEGRELYVGILGNDKPVPLPILEWDFSSVPDGLPKIASSTAKWDEQSAYKQTLEVFPKDIPENVYQEIQGAAVQAFKALKLRDYGRIDLRLRRAGPAGNDPDWESFVIEVNPNPHLDGKGEFPIMARQHGLSFPEMLEKIVEVAMARDA